MIVTVTLAALLDFSHITTYLSTSESLETLHLTVIEVAVVESMLKVFSLGAVTAVEKNITIFGHKVAKK